MSEAIKSLARELAAKRLPIRAAVEVFTLLYLAEKLALEKSVTKAAESAGVNRVAIHRRTRVAKK